MNYECSTPNGCGSNDDCNFDENCIRDRLASGGYRCQGNTVEKIIMGFRIRYEAETIFT